MRKSRKLRRSHKTKKRGGSFWNPFTWFSKSSDTPPDGEPVPAVGSVPVSSNISNSTATVNNVAKTANAAAKAPSPANPQQGKTTHVVNPTSGGMAPINMKEPMFYPTPKQLDWACTAGLPTKGGSRRHKHRNKKSKRKSRR